MTRHGTCTTCGYLISVEGRCPCTHPSLARETSSTARVIAGLREDLRQAHQAVVDLQEMQGAVIRFLDQQMRCDGS